MRKLIIIIVGIISLIFIIWCVLLGIDNKYVNNLKEDISNNVGIDNIQYVNRFDEHYLVKDNEYLYLFNSDYEQITSIKLNLVYDNKNNYDIVYRNKTIMYMDNYKNKEGIVFKYYDIYTYELIDKIVVGGN